MGVLGQALHPGRGSRQGAGVEHELLAFGHRLEADETGLVLAPAGCVTVVAQGWAPCLRGQPIRDPPQRFGRVLPGRGQDKILVKVRERGGARQTGVAAIQNQAGRGDVDGVVGLVRAFEVRASLQPRPLGEDGFFVVACVYVFCDFEKNNYFRLFLLLRRS